MSDLQIFHNEQFGQMRGFLDDEGNPWFVAKDVCKALELSDVSMTLKNLDDDEKGTSSICTPGGSQNMSVINESGLYSLILRSRKPEAKTFKRWITHEVIPSIRKTGQYHVGLADETINAVTQPGEFFDLPAYISVLRQMARLKSYPDRMRMEFLAEAAGLLSGYPPSRFMPPEEAFYSLFQ